MIFGNLAVEREGNVTVFSLNTYHKGVPRALMTDADIANLVAHLKAPAPKPQKLKKIMVVVPEDDFNVDDYI